VRILRLICVEGDQDRNWSCQRLGHRRMLEFHQLQQAFGIVGHERGGVNKELDHVYNLIFQREERILRSVQYYISNLNA